MSQPSPINEDVKTLFDATPVPMLITGLDGSLEYANTAVLDLLGYTEEEIFCENIIISHPDDLGQNKNIRTQLIANPTTPIITEKRYIHKDGSVINGLLTIGAELNANGDISRCIAQIIDLSEIRETQNELRLFKALVKNSHDGLFILDAADGSILDCNDRACTMLGYSLEEMQALKTTDIVLQIDTENDWQEHAAKVKKRKLMVREGTHLRKDGGQYPVETSLSYVSQQNHNYIIAISRETSDRKRTEELIRRQANFDALTNLPNRRYITEHLNYVLALAKNEEYFVALLSLDLDQFKDVNDTLGHALGDILLKKAALRISGCVQKHDMVARMGGDEFVIILDKLASIESVELVAESIIKELAKPFSLQLNEVYVSASIGISIFPADGKTGKNLFIQADQAMYAAKREGKNRYHFFTPALQRRAEAHSWTSQALQQALPNNEFELAYQPVINLQNGRCVGAEALLRWNHPMRGSIPPNEFIPIAELNGKINAIGAWVVTTAVEQLAHWQSSLDKHFKISVNTSPLQFKGSHRIFQRWKKFLNEYELTKDTLVIEITENAILEANIGAEEKLLFLRDLGVQVAIDDFGTGYSSLAYLRKFDIDFLKIDQSFIKNLSTDANDQILCKAIVAMAHNLGLKVIAEGIETVEHANMLQAIGCDFGQGYFFSKPISKEAFEAHYKLDAFNKLSKTANAS